MDITTLCAFCELFLHKWVNLKSVLIDQFSFMCWIEFYIIYLVIITGKNEIIKTNTGANTLGNAPQDFCRLFCIWVLVLRIIIFIGNYILAPFQHYIILPPIFPIRKKQGKSKYRFLTQYWEFSIYFFLRYPLTIN